ncbi:putative NBD/HSP70 family sugar kinase [Scopulibacillus darangshiensis]|uniref:Putative NBD/HSP70 family sugar kinase n=1 Tax=Scopulibacillus darangshiensis TaxID=442528 RepID=A0A4R2P431_9BACL|nr:ROK family transcriptional regulator [Scopulibacillus darangshiensis]TCP29550.1 putative NBD/HSP70 family sugar kinase [Scopulibacillus darangshiensis]
MKKKDQNYIKKENKGLVLELIRTLGPVSRAKIARVTNMSPTTVSRIVSSLIELNFVEETDQMTSGVGRKANLLAVKASSILSIGIELDEKLTRVGFIDFLGNIVCLEEYHRDSGGSPALVIAQLKKYIQELIEKHHIQTDKIKGVCVGLPGLINADNGHVDLSVQMQWRQVEFAKQLKDVLGYDVIIDNELKLKAYAEGIFGKGKKSKKMAMIGFGSGVGSSLIVDGDIYRGHSNYAGEIGHTVVDSNGILCSCGNFGCLQTYIAEPFLLEEASKKGNVRSLQDLIATAKSNENWAINIIERAITYAAITINNVVCVNNPDMVVLTGSLIEQSNYMRERIFNKCTVQIWEPLKDSFTLETSSLGSQGVILGAGMKIQKEFIKQLNFEEVLLK